MSTDHLRPVRYASWAVVFFGGVLTATAWLRQGPRMGASVFVGSMLALATIRLNAIVMGRTVARAEAESRERDAENATDMKPADREAPTAPEPSAAEPSAQPAIGLLLLKFIGVLALALILFGFRIVDGVGFVFGYAVLVIGIVAGALFGRPKDSEENDDSD